MARTIELADGVYRIATDNYRLNTGLILGLEKALVIDTGAGPRQATEIYDEGMVIFPCLNSTSPFAYQSPI